MHRLVLALRTPLALAVVIMYASTYPAAGPDPATVEQPAATHVRVADDPDVLGAERLFSAWMEGQIAYRSLPGVVVGVVSDQDLVWARGSLRRGRRDLPQLNVDFAGHASGFPATRERSTRAPRQ